MNAPESLRWLAHARSDWAVEARYPSDTPEVMENDAQEALQSAGCAFDLIEQDIRAQIESESPM